MQIFPIKGLEKIIKSNTNINLIVNRLIKNGFDVYMVGGFVRDIFLGKKYTDIDLVTSAKTEEIQELMKDQKIDLVGKSYLVLIINGVEVSTYRNDTYKNKNVAITEAKTVQEDASRRDLTINQIYINCKNGEVIDTYKGRDDLKKRRIKFVGTAKDRIYEDPNRIIRACRFLAVIDGIFGPSTKESLTDMGYLVKDYVSPERIHIEVMKAMKARYASVFFNALHEIGVLQYIFPSLDCCYYFDVHGLHHRESIITHSLLTGDYISTKYPLVKLAAYLHDVGKPLACRFNPKSNDIAFAGHDVEGKYLVIEELKKLTFPNKDIDYISTLVRLHMSSFKTEKAIRRAVKKLNERDIDFKDLYRIGLADAKANIMRGHHSYSEVKENLMLIEKALDVKSENRFDQLVINGKDIMEITGLKAGPEIGKIKNFLLDAILDNPKLNNKPDLKLLIGNEKWIE